MKNKEFYKEQILDITCSGERIGIVKGTNILRPCHNLMLKFKCKCKCGGTEFFIKKIGIHTGLYCKECGAFIKWLNKDEIRVIECREKSIKEYEYIKQMLGVYIEDYTKDEFVEWCCNQDLNIPLQMLFELLYDYLKGELNNGKENN